MAVQAADEGTVFRTADGPARDHLALAIREAADAHAGDRAYQAELVAWSGRYESFEGVPAANVPAPDDSPGAPPGRVFAEPRLAQPSGSAGEDDESVLAVIATASDDPMSQLRAGEATSAVALMATSLGLASCPLTEALEIRDTRELIRTQVTGGSFPQMVLRLGWAPVNADPLPATPRRPLEDVVRDLTSSGSKAPGPRG